MAKLLIVDDQEQNRYILEVLLKGKGYEVISASNGAEALEMARQDPPDVIITDILMPTMDGFALCREWRKDPVLSGVPFIFYTATYTDSKDEKLALSLGADRFIIKPTEPEKFLSILKEVLEEHQNGRLKSTRRPIKEETVLLKEYNEALVHKLEDKVKQLEELNAALKYEVLQRSRTQDELSRSEEKYRTLMEAVADPVIVYDLEGQVSYINQAFSKVFGWSKDEVLGKRLDFIPPEIASETMLKIDQVLHGQLCSNYETRRKAKGGSLIDVSISAAAYKDVLGQAAGIVVSLQDITSRKAAEVEKSKLEAQLRQSQKMEAIGTLAGGIAHDFNNILGVIIGFADLCKLLAHDDQKMEANLQRVLDAGMRAKDLVKQILTFSRQTDQEFKPTRIGVVVEELTKMLKATTQPSIEIEATVKDDCIVMADPTQLHQVMMNMCTNAVQAMQDNGGMLEVVLEKTEFSEDSVRLVAGLKPGVYQMVSISDTGTGISKEVLERIFDPFFTTKKPGEGTGLGLSVAHGIIKNHGGKITVYSEPGKGTTFKLYLPVLNIQDEQDANSAVVENLPTGDENILYVDDEELLVDVGTQILNALGYQVTSFCSSLEALEDFRRQPEKYDLVVSDLNMPKMNGVDLAKEISNLRPDIPVILCTGFSESISGRISRSNNVKRMIMKPVVAHDIARAVREVLG